MPGQLGVVLGCGTWIMEVSPSCNFLQTVDDIKFGPWPDSIALLGELGGPSLDSKHQRHKLIKLTPALLAAQDVGRLGEVV